MKEKLFNAEGAEKQAQSAQNSLNRKGREERRRVRQSDRVFICPLLFCFTLFPDVVS